MEHSISQHAERTLLLAVWVHCAYNMLLLNKWMGLKVLCDSMYVKWLPVIEKVLLLCTKYFYSPCLLDWKLHSRKVIQIIWIHSWKRNSSISISRHFTCLSDEKLSLAKCILCHKKERNEIWFQERQMNSIFIKIYHFPPYAMHNNSKLQNSLEI